MQLDLETPEIFEPLLGRSRYKGAYGGRGGAKSHFFADMLVERHVMDKTDSVCIREVQKSIKNSVKKLIEGKIQSLGVAHLFQILETEIRCENGGVIIFQGMQNHTAESIKSLEGYDIAWIEEAQSLSHRSLKLLRPTIRKPGSEIWASWNPRYATDPIDKLLRGAIPPDDAVVIKVNYYDNPWFPEELQKEMESDKQRDYDEYAHVWLGEYESISDAQILKGKFEIKDFEPQDDWHGAYFGADFGFSQDPTTLIKLWIYENTLYVEHELYAVGVEIDDLPEFFKGIEGSQRYIITADSARPETISHLRRHGFNARGSEKGKGSVEEGIAHLRSFSKIIVHPRCVRTIEECRLYQYKTDRLSGDILPVPKDDNNHIIDAMRYALEQVMKRGLGAGIAYEEVKTNRWDDDEYED